MGKCLILIFFSLIICLSQTDNAEGYDPLDPNGNITIKWDIMQWNNDRYDAKVSIFNFQLFRHVERPGWTLRWTWRGDEVIWSMSGAEATEQGNCTRFRGEIPHSCEKEPVIIDLLPDSPYSIQVANCCKGGVLSSMMQDPGKYGAVFLMNVGTASNAYANGTNTTMPVNFTLGVPGYTCGKPSKVPPSRFNVDQGRRRTQALYTWNVTCSYSQFRASPAPTCCVSLSSFYNDTIVPCPQCSCSCQGLPGTTCSKPGEPPPLLQLPHNDEEALPALVRCSWHMCPIRVHWHVKLSYKEYWRVKITITNLNIVRNFSQWNLVVLHPSLRSVSQVFSFNYKPLNQYGHINDTGMFWGIKYYNDMLLQAGEAGNVQTEMLLHKDKEMFTFKEGWAFPRKVSFNGEECVMPSPDQYPRLPNNGDSILPATLKYIILYKLTLFIFL